MRFEGLKQFKDIGLDLNKGVNTCTVTRTHTNTHTPHTHTHMHTHHTHQYTHQHTHEHTLHTNTHTHTAHTHMHTHHTHTPTHTHEHTLHTNTHTAHTYMHTQTHAAHTPQPSTLHMYTSLVFDIHRVDEVSVGGSSRILLHGETHWGDTVPCVVQPNGACVTRQTCSTSTCVCPCMHFLVVCNDGFYPSASVGMVTA